MSEPTAATVLQSNDGQYRSYRIPALLRLRSGAILLFCEGRKHEAHDFGQIHMLVLRSDDQGRTWSQPRVVYREGSDQDRITIGNPCPVEDADTGRVWLMLTRNNEQVLVTHSDDAGQTWAPPDDITAQVGAPGWLRYWTGPGHGIQLQRGPHAGRLLMPCYHLEPWQQDGPDLCASHCVYSDDHGRSWTFGANTPGLAGVDPNELIFTADWCPQGFVWAGGECLAAELHTGELYMTVRNQVCYRQRKAFTRSTDGGKTWDPLQLHDAIPGPKCQSGLLQLPTPDQPETDTLILTGIDPPAYIQPSPADDASDPAAPPGRRVHLSAWTSPDAGQTWSAPTLLHAGPAAYSDLCPTGSGQVLCVYEGGENGAHEGLQATFITP